VKDAVESCYREERIAAEILECKRSGHPIWKSRTKSEISEY
jgi:hypothetical protein